MIYGLRQGRPAFLASVTNAAEAETALAGGADIIDCKDPSSGALGALDLAAVREIVTRIDGRLPVSATVGDLPPVADVLVNAVDRMAETGVDIVKIGIFAGDDPRAAIAALGSDRHSSTPLVAVLMADQRPDFSLLTELAAAGFFGVMLDTADKSSGRLPTVLPLTRLDEFVKLARNNDLFVGLAGSLKGTDIPALAALQPDMLGFRGALCSAGRVSSLERDRLDAIRQEIDKAKRAIAREKTVA